MSARMNTDLGLVEQLADALLIARWYVERSKHITDLGRMKRDKDLSVIDHALSIALSHAKACLAVQS